MVRHSRIPRSRGRMALEAWGARASAREMQGGSFLAALPVEIYLRQLPTNGVVPLPFRTRTQLAGVALLR